MKSRSLILFLLCLLVLSCCCLCISDTTLIYNNNKNDEYVATVVEQDDDDVYGSPYSKLFHSVNRVVDAFRQPIVQKVLTDAIPGGSTFFSNSLLRSHSDSTEFTTKSTKKQRLSENKPDDGETESMTNNDDDDDGGDVPIWSWNDDLLRDASDERNDQFLVHLRNKNNKNRGEFNQLEQEYVLHGGDDHVTKRSIMSTMSTDDDWSPCAVNSSSIYASYMNRTYICNGQVVTQQEYERQILIDPLTNNCTMNEQRRYVCFCPLDLSGVDCGVRRQFECKTQLVAPERKCQKPSEVGDSYGGLELDGDFPCLWFTMDDQVDFVFNMTCQFTEKANVDTNQANLPRNETYTVYFKDGNTTDMTWSQIQSNFTYFVNHNYTRWVNGTERVTGTFALSKPLEKPLVFKAYNFNSLSDESGVHKTSLSHPNHYIGLKTVKFNVKFNNLTEDMFAGDRLYCDVQIYSVPGLTMPWERLFVDFTDRSPPVFKNVKVIVLASVLPPVGTAVLIVLAIIIFLYYRKQHQERKEIKSY